jgi:hypothetical protein
MAFEPESDDRRSKHLLAVTVIKKTLVISGDLRCVLIIVHIGEQVGEAKNYRCMR